MQTGRLKNVGCTDKEKRKKRQKRASESYIIHYFFYDIYNNETIQRCDRLPSAHGKVQEVIL